jgi:hypothetical protein
MVAYLWSNGDNCADIAHAAIVAQHITLGIVRSNYVDLTGRPGKQLYRKN